MQNNIHYRIFIDGHLAEATSGEYQVGELFDIVERLDSTEKAIDVLDWTTECEIGDLYEYDDWSVLCCYGALYSAE